jgi:hypothetical protein
MYFLRLRLTNNVSPVSFQPQPGCYVVRGRGSIDFTLSTDSAGTTIHYTTDGSDPTESDPIYEGPIRLDEREDPYTVKARAFGSCWDTSDVAEGVYKLVKSRRECK